MWKQPTERDQMILGWNCMSDEESAGAEWESILAGKGKDNLADVLERGWDELNKRDYNEVSVFGRCAYDDELELFNLKFFGEPFVVDLRSRKIFKHDPDSGVPADLPTVSTFLATLMVHYLSSVKNIDIEGKLITFRELPGGGDIYYPAFQNNAIRPVKERYGGNPGAIIPAGERLGGKPVRMGDAAVELPVFPKIPVTVIVWAGDDEVPANANILFDVTAKEQMHIEDLAVIGGVVAGKLMK